MKSRQFSSGAKLLWRSFFTNNRLCFAGTVATRLAVSVISLLYSYILMDVTNTVVAGSLDGLGLDLLLCLTLIVGELAVMLLRRALMPRFLERAIQNYRNQAFRLLFGKRAEALADSGGASGIVSMLTNDVTVIRDTYLNQFFRLISDCCTFCATLVLLFMQSPIILLTAVAASGISIASGTALSSPLAKRQEDMSTSGERLVATVKEMVSGFPLIKAFGANAQAVSSLDAASGRLEHDRYRVERTQMAIDTLSASGYDVAQLSVLLVGAWLCITGQGVSVGGVLFSLQVMNYISQPIQQIPPYWPPARQLVPSPRSSPPRLRQTRRKSAPRGCRTGLATG